MAAPIPILEFSQRALELYGIVTKRPKTRQKIRQILRELAATLGPAATTADLSTEAIVRWMTLYAPRRSPNTVIGHLSNLRTLCLWAIEEGWLDHCPAFRRLRPRAVASPELGHLSRVQIVELLRHLKARATDWKGRRLYALVATAIYTGLRRDELLFLRMQDVDLAGALITVVPLLERALKTPESARAVPVPPELIGLLSEWVTHVRGPWLFPGVTGRGAWHGGSPGYRPVDALKAACAACGLPPATWQWLRRSWATHGEYFGLSDEQIMSTLGHTSSATWRRWYRRVDRDNLRAIGERITYL